MPGRSKAVRARVQRITRVIIQIFFFIFFPSAYSAAFSGVKLIFSQMGLGERVEWSSMLAILVTLLAFTIVFGRFFCGYACAFGSMGDWLYLLHLGILKKMKKKPKKIPAAAAKKQELIKYVVLIAIVVAIFTGVYGRVQGTSPWEVFSLLYNFRAPGRQYTAGLIILLVIMAGMFFEERFFCRFLCPMGAIFSILPMLPPFTLRRNRPECIKGCHRCETVCPCSIGLPDERSMETRGECFMCGACSVGCPKSNIHCGCSRKLKGHELWFTILRAALLALIFIRLGV